MSGDSFNKTLDFNKKFIYFISAWALIEVVVIDAVYKFINILNNQQSIHLPKNFDPSNVLWGESILLNLLKVVVVGVFAFIFGITYSYLARKVLESDKASISVANAIFGVLGTFLIILFTLWAIAIFRHQDFQIRYYLSQVIFAIRSSAIYTGFLLAQILVVGISSFIGLTVGQNLVENLNIENKGRLFGIKWYHFFWLWLSISIYVQALLWLIYFTLHTFMQFIHQFKFIELFGATTSSSGQDSNSFTALSTSLIFVYIIAVIIVYLMKYQREILSGDTKVNTFIKIFASIGISFVIPAMLLIYTVIGSSYVR